MPRPRKPRCINASAPATYFKPRGIPLSALREAVLEPEDFEALRLADVEGLDAMEAARAMGVSRHTFGRILRKARCVTAQALVNGWALRIEPARIESPGVPAKVEEHIKE